MIKINRKAATVTCTMLLIFFVAMQLEWIRLIILCIIVTLFYLANKCINSEPFLYRFNIKIRKVAQVLLLINIIFMFIQIIILRLSFIQIVRLISINSCIYIGIIFWAIGVKTVYKFEHYLYPIVFFVILFCMYYLLSVFIKGLPEDRGSILGNVSSNFCCTILYLNFPLILYYLFGREQKKPKVKKYCVLALVLSTFVILISGSRTSLGAVGIITTLLLLYKRKGAGTRIKMIFTVIIMFFISLGAYYFIPGIQKMLSRGLQAFNGKTLGGDVRMIIWNAAWNQFLSGNVWVGSGSSEVIRFDRSAHNLFFEVLLCSGYLGVILFIITMSIPMLLLLRREEYMQRYFSFMLIVVSLLVAFVQPFYSSSYICSIFTWQSLLAFYNDIGEYRNVRIYGTNQLSVDKHN